MHPTPRVRSVPILLRDVVACVSVVFALVIAPLPRVSAAILPSLTVSLVSVSGSATNTVTSLNFINDTTIQIEADQVGYLTHFGNFTGHFSYLASASPTTILLLGKATLTNEHGDQLFLTASILEVGADYPRSLNGVLTVTGGTGGFAGAKGTISVSGTDEESLTDTVTLNGALLVAGLH
jgi:hypothetical protein